MPTQTNVPTINYHNWRRGRDLIGVPFKRGQLVLSAHGIQDGCYTYVGWTFAQIIDIEYSENDGVLYPSMLKVRLDDEIKRIAPNNTVVVGEQPIKDFDIYEFMTGL